MRTICVYCSGKLVYRHRQGKPTLRRCKGPCGHERELTHRDLGQPSPDDNHEAWKLSK